MCIWKLYLRFETETDQNRLFPRFEMGTNRNKWTVYDKCKPLSRTQCTSISEVESPMYLYMSQYMYDMSYCKDVKMII